jgi:hypothetical protein
LAQNANAGGIGTLLMNVHEPNIEEVLVGGHLCELGGYLSLRGCASLSFDKAWLFLSILAYVNLVL